MMAKCVQRTPSVAEAAASVPMAASSATRVASIPCKTISSVAQSTTVPETIRMAFPVRTEHDAKTGAAPHNAMVPRNAVVTVASPTTHAVKTVTAVHPTCSARTTTGASAPGAGWSVKALVCRLASAATTVIALRTQRVVTTTA